MTIVRRILDADTVGSLDEYVAAGGGLGLDAARELGPGGTIEHVAAAGLRGRGGAGFPTGTKWQTITEFREAFVPVTLVVNAAEGEPGTFKDRTLLRVNPYRVLEGALIAALAVGADRAVVAMKRTFEPELARTRDAIAEMGAAGWGDAVELDVFAGPTEYLYGEETALLEALAGRPPFPRIAPPYRHGADEVSDAEPTAPATVERADPSPSTVVPPTLVNNVETLANVPGILAEGPEWFRAVGTDASPGTVVCTVSGATRTHAVGEFALGTPIGEVLERLGGGAVDGRELVAVMSGVAHPLVPASQFDTPMTYEDLEEIGAALGAAGFIAFDDATDLVGVAQGVARFLAVESCGQCTPCKRDSLTIAESLDALRGSSGEGDHHRDTVEQALETVTEGARCFLAYQTQRVVGSVLRLFPEHVDAHVSGRAGAPPPALIAPIIDIDGGRAQLEEDHWHKQPDWSYGDTWSGKVPAEAVDVRSDEE